MATTPKPKKPRAAPSPTFANFALWKKVALDESDDDDRSFDLLEATNDSVDFEDLFGEQPEHAMVCGESVSIAGPLRLNGWKAKKGHQQTLYVIDGDLSIDGPLVFSQSDICTTLWVKGRVKASHVALFGSAVLICDDVDVRDAIVTHLDDAGHFIVHGSCAARVWIGLSHRGCIELDRAPQARLLSDAYAADALEAPPIAGEDDEPAPWQPRAAPWEPAAPALRSALVRDGEAHSAAVLAAVERGEALLGD